MNDKVEKYLAVLQDHTLEFMGSLESCSQHPPTNSPPRLCRTLECISVQ